MVNLSQLQNNHQKKKNINKPILRSHWLGTAYYTKSYQSKSTKKASYRILIFPVQLLACTIKESRCQISRSSVRTPYRILRIRKFFELQVTQTTSCSLWQVNRTSSCEAVCRCCWIIPTWPDFFIYLKSLISLVLSTVNKGSPALLVSAVCRQRDSEATLNSSSAHPGRAASPQHAQ